MASVFFNFSSHVMLSSAISLSASYIHTHTGTMSHSHTHTHNFAHDLSPCWVGLVTQWVERSLFLDCWVLWVRIPPRAALFSSKIVCFSIASKPCCCFHYTTCAYVYKEGWVRVAQGTFIGGNGGAKTFHVCTKCTLFESLEHPNFVRWCWPLKFNKILIWLEKYEPWVFRRLWVFRECQVLPLLQ